MSQNLKVRQLKRVSEMSELDEIRQKKIEELQVKAEQQAQEGQKQAEALKQIDSLMRNLLDEKARERLNNVRLVNKERYLQAAQSIIYLVNAGKIKGKLSDAELKQLLSSLSKAEKREFTITRK